MSRPCVWLISAYQRFVSPLFGKSCRFYPCCSAYAKEALLLRSFPVAVRLIVWRLAKCHPFHPGGYDPLEFDEDNRGDAALAKRKGSDAKVAEWQEGPILSDGAE